MSNTSIQTVTEPRPAVTPPPPDVKPRPRRVHPLLKALKTLASLRLTVFLFVLALFLVFAGTLAQVDESTWSAVHKYFRWGDWGLVWIPFQVFVRFAQTFFGVSKDAVVPGSFPFPAGWTVGGLLLVNLLAAHTVRFKISWKRSGILLIHGGLILMMIGEFIYGAFGVEGLLTVREGETSNYLEDHNTYELAIINPANPGYDDVVVIPDSRLQPGKTIRSDLLPFDVQVIRYMYNSSMRNSPAAATDEANPATKGLGLQAAVVEKRRGAGVDQSARFDIPSAYVTLKDKKTGESLGTYLLSGWFPLLDQPDQKVRVGDQAYEMSLRFKRTYKPYHMHLLKATTEFYPGTTKPKSYSSLVRLVDPTRHEDREVLIYMNQPLRYQGETFYQSGMNGNQTILQVARNPGWLLPYISCGLVSLGMLIHFGLNLSTFLKRRSLS